MADQDLEIRVRSSADLAALNQAKATIDTLASTTQKVNWAQVREDTDRFQASMAAHAKDVAGDTTGYQGLTGAAAAAERFGVNISRTRNEFTTLIREMAAGAPISRTLGALLGALGFKLVGVAAAIVGPFAVAAKAAKETSEQVAKIDESVGKQNEELDQSAQKWEAIARSATTTKDVAKLAAEGATIFRSTADQNRRVQAEQLGVTSKLVELIANSATPIGGILGQAWKPFSNSLKEAQTEQQKMLANTEEEVSHIVDVAKRGAMAWENLYAQPTTQSINELSAKIVAYKGYLDSIDTKPGPGFEARMEDYKITAQRVADFAAQLQAVISLQKQEIEISGNLVSADDKRLKKLTAINAELEKQGVHSRTAQGVFEEGKKIPGPAGEFVRELAGELGGLEKQGVNQLVGDIAKTPQEEIKAEMDRRAQHFAQTAAQRALGIAETPEQEQRFKEEEERRSLLREQTLALSLIPPGFEETPSVFLGKEGARKFRLRGARLKELEKTLGEPNLGELNRAPIPDVVRQGIAPGTNTTTGKQESLGEASTILGSIDSTLKTMLGLVQ